MEGWKVLIFCTFCDSDETFIFMTKFCNKKLPIFGCFFIPTVLWKPDPPKNEQVFMQIPVKNAEITKYN